MIEYLKAVLGRARYEAYDFWWTKVRPHTPRFLKAVRWDIDHRPGRIFDRGFVLHRIHDHPGCIQHGNLDTFVPVDFPIQLIRVLGEVQHAVELIHEDGVVGDLADRIENLRVLLGTHASYTNRNVESILASRQEEIQSLWPDSDNQMVVLGFVGDNETERDAASAETNEQFFAMIDREDWNLGPDH